MTEAELSFTFLTQGGQSAVDVANQVADFIGAANHTLELALYDCRLSEPLKAIVTAALRERSAAGVGIRIAYDADKPEVPAVDRGADPAESGTGVYIASLGYPYRRIGGMKLMHSKYIVRDAGFPNAAVWTGSTNFTDDSWTLQENNIVRLYAPEVALDYARDFAQLWDSGQLDGTGSFDTSAYTYNIDGEQTNVRAIFSPGRGHDIDTEVACLVGSAGHRVRLCSMLLNSGTLLRLRWKAYSANGS